MSWVSLARKKNCIDTHLEIQFEKERCYRRKLLERVVAIVKFLSQRGLAFRGQNVVFGYDNNGNFLGIIELLANSILSSKITCPFFTLLELEEAMR